MATFFIYVFSWIVVVAGLVGLSIGIRNLRQGYLSLRWPSVEGLITSLGATEHCTDGETFVLIPHITYDYSVGGIAYSGSRIAFGDDTSVSLGYARSVCSRYPTGKQVRVFYNPSEPSSSVLDAGPAHAAWFATFASGVFLVVGLALSQLLPKYFPHH